MNDVLEEQKRYHAARAPECDDWWLKRGRYAVDADVLAELGFGLRLTANGNFLYGFGS